VQTPLLLTPSRAWGSSSHDSSIVERRRPPLSVLASGHIPIPDEKHHSKPQRVYRYQESPTLGR